MICPQIDCGGQVRVSHTYSAGSVGKTHGGICSKCGRRVVAVTVVFEDLGKRGESAYMRAKRMRQEHEEALRKKASPF